MQFRNWKWIFAGCGCLLICLGFWQWRQKHGPADAIQAFVSALREGNSQAALSQLTSRQAQLARDRIAAGESDWQPSPGLTCSIRQLKIFGSLATAEVILQDRGYKVQPTFTLERDSQGGWQIAEISGAVTDPRWEDDRQRQQQVADEQLALELNRALRGAPTVLVENPDENRRE